MIGSLRGALVDSAPSGAFYELLVEVDGVGYRLHATPRVAATFGDTGDEVFVWVHHHIRDDDQQLYGFTQRDERVVFEALISAHGVGPALALSILAVHSPVDLRVAIATDDVDALCLVPGVGKKTAARMLVELKSKLDAGDIDLTQIAGVADGSSAATNGSAHGDVRDALVELGYGAEEIGEAVRGLPDVGETAELLRLALQKLGANA
ncbi:MAG: Holliday junction branch migration protein RuvA [Acidimicrobiia bacterium]|nr:Holliday junction branch migration protein RuvA [Acidimicrobiia bacterium]